MILANFQQVQQQRFNNQKKINHHKAIHNQQKQSYHQSQQSIINNSRLLQSTNHHNHHNNKVKRQQRKINDYLNQLGIGNVQQFYSQQQIIKKNKQYQKIKQIRQQSLLSTINRLYSSNNNGLINKKNNEQNSKKTQKNKKSKQKLNNNKMINNKCQQQGLHNNQQDQQQEQYQQNEQVKQQQQHNKQYYNELYEQQQGFDYRFRIKKLQLQCVKIKQKLFNKFCLKYQIWTALNQKDIISKQLLQTTFKTSNPKYKYKIILVSTVQSLFVKSLLNFILIKNYNHYKSNNNHQKSNNNLQKSNNNLQKSNNNNLQKSNNNNSNNNNNQNNKINNNTKTNKQNKITNNQQLFSKYSDYLNKHNYNYFNKLSFINIQFTNQTYQHIKQQAHQLPFIYYLLDFQNLQKIQQVNFNNIQQLQTYINNKYNTQRNLNFIYHVFQNKLNPKFTIPYQTKLYQVKEQSNHQLIQQQQNNQLQNRQPIKAKPIPNSTYHKPKQRPASSKKSTQVIPFNFTQTHSNIPKTTADQIYSWNRNFKAKPIPKTVYQPQLIGINDKQKQYIKKQHIQKLYHQSKYPKTMCYLQNLTEYQQQRRKQLQQKHLNNNNKNAQRQNKVKQIPDFKKIHKKQTQLLQTRKQINRTNTQPKPFNFTQTRKSDERNILKSTYIFNKQLQNQNRPKKKHINVDTSMPQARSTAKFDAYINMRKEQKQQKKISIKQRQQLKKRKQQDMKQYKQILKQRMHNQLLNQPKPIIYNNGNTNNQNIVKVNLQQIYLEKPLLMTSTQNTHYKNKNKLDDQKTCFTDHFQPII